MRKTRAIALWLRATAYVAVSALGFALAGSAAAQAPQQEDRWPWLANQIFEGRPLQDGGKMIALDAPYRAEDAAVVPVTIRTLLSPGDSRRVRRITLVIDNNPAPVAAVIEPGATSKMDSWSTRVRVDSYTDMHAVAEMNDGALYVATRFVKAAGGCSAPALKQEADPIPLGTMRFRLFEPAGDPARSKPSRADISSTAAADSVRSDDTGADRQGASPPPPLRREAQVMIRHPNYSGLQMDQVTRLYIPARFVRTVRVWQGDDLLFSVEGGISLSENPQFRFDYVANGATTVRAEAVDTDSKVFTQTWSAADRASM